MSSFGSSSGSSSLVSTYADQPMYTAQNKSEPVTNQAFNMFLDALSLLRPRDDSSSTLEWAKAHDSLSIPLPSKIVVESIDDGGLVLRYRDASDKWTRHPTHIRYCAIEAKSEHLTVDGSHSIPDHVYAQEFSHIIGMIHQHESYLRNLNEIDERVIPLLSVSQNHLSLLIAKYDLSYYEFLLMGDDKNEPFLNVIEYGTWDLCEGVDLRVSAAMILAMMDALEDRWFAS